MIEDSALSSIFPSPGSPLPQTQVVVVTNLVIENIEERALSSFHTPPRFWRRYRDDICTALSQDLVTSFHQHLNSIHFTVKKESSGQMPFLDVLLMREEDGTVSTLVYRKPTHTDQYLAFESYHRIGHKRAVVRTLMNRAEALCSSGVS